MSLTNPHPHSSPPRTPRRPIMAIVNEKLAERSASKMSSTPISTPITTSKLPQRTRSPRLSAADIQVPATQPAQTSPLKASHTPQLDHGDDSTHSMDTESENSEANIEFDAEDPKADLPVFSWEEFESRYERAIRAASDKEDDLLKEFDNLTEAFTIWAESSSQHDNDRALKRLKTRERYVQLAENSLRDKKKHHLQVVEAFKAALNLFE